MEVWKTYDYLITEAVQSNTTGGSPVYMSELHWSVLNQIKSSAKYTSPLNNLSVQDLKSNRAVSIRDQFLRYLKQGEKGYHKDAVKLDKHVEYTIREIMKMLNNNMLKKKYSVYPNFEAIRKARKY